MKRLRDLKAKSEALQLATDPNINALLSTVVSSLAVHELSKAVEKNADAINARTARAVDLEIVRVALSKAEENRPGCWDRNPSCECYACLAHRALERIGR